MNNTTDAPSPILLRDSFMCATIIHSRHNPSAKWRKPPHLQALSVLTGLVYQGILGLGHGGYLLLLLVLCGPGEFTVANLPCRHVSGDPCYGQLVCTLTGAQRLHLEPHLQL